MKTREDIQLQLNTLDEAALSAVALFIAERERQLQADAEYAVREQEANKQMALLREFASDWTEEESFEFEMGVKGLPLRSADAEANASEARLFATMLGSSTLEDRINALLSASQGRDEYVLAALRMVKTLVEPMTWEQERAFDIGLMARLWRKHDRLERHELATFTLALVEKLTTSDLALNARVAARNEALSTSPKENP